MSSRSLFLLVSLLVPLLRLAYSSAGYAAIESSPRGKLCSWCGGSRCDFNPCHIWRRQCPSSSAVLLTWAVLRAVYLQQPSRVLGFSPTPSLIFPCSSSPSFRRGSRYFPEPSAGPVLRSVPPHPSSHLRSTSPSICLFTITSLLARPLRVASSPQPLSSLLLPSPEAPALTLAAAGGAEGMMRNERKEDGVVAVASGVALTDEAGKAEVQVGRKGLDKERERRKLDETMTYEDETFKRVTLMA
ncbi:hypothetical protein C8R45DRAFT_201723 [Mycena sanguinolenta]|nr:hypothetical protein C8R45DRAFT_201723 [Mycena sanguinolenta]